MPEELILLPHAWHLEQPPEESGRSGVYQRIQKRTGLCMERRPDEIRPNSNETNNERFVEALEYAYESVIS